MIFKKILIKLKFYWVPFFLSTIPTLVLVRVRFLSDRGYGRFFNSFDFKLLFFSVIEDLFIQGLISLLAFLTLPSKFAMIFSFLLVAINSITVLFYGVFGAALTVDLLDQVGDVFSVIGSTNSTSNKLIFLLFIFALIYLALFRLIYRFRQSIKFLFLYLCLFIFFMGGIVYFDKEKHVEISYNPILRSFISPAIDKKVNQKEIIDLMGKAPEEIPYVKSIKNSETKIKKNIIVIVLETADYEWLISDERKFSEVMPYFFELSKNKHSSFFREHRTVWPFSSKSLYSISCGFPTALGSAIDFRFLYDVDCMGWISQLSKAGYELGIFYSGDLRYDNMGKFFKTQGVKFFWDRYKASSKYEMVAWGVDDEATYKAFLDWAPLKKPFASLIIPINSHYPFWTPSRSKLRKFNDPYTDAFVYQDDLIKSLFSDLKKKNLLKDTVIFITGDHGAQFSDLSLTRSLDRKILTNGFHVPLLVYDESRNNNLQVAYPTSHMDISGAVIDSSGLEGKYLKNHNLKHMKPVFSFFKGVHFIVQVNNDEGNVVSFDLGEKKYHYFNRLNKSYSETCNFKFCEQSEQWLINYYWMSVSRKKN